MMALYVTCCIMTITDEELKEMKKLLMIAPWTKLYLSCEEKG